MDPNDLNHVCALVLKRSGIVLDPSKEYLVEARLAMLAKKLGVPLDVTAPKAAPTPTPDTKPSGASVRIMRGRAVDPGDTPSMFDL